MTQPGQETRPSPASDPERTNRDALATVIERRAQDIERRWRESVERELADGQDDPPTELRDALRDYLLRLSQALHGDESIDRGGAAAWADLAREHALTRVRQGFDIDQLVRELIVLRRVLSETAREEQLAVNDRQDDWVADLIEAAIAKSVRSYTESRDSDARRQQAEHIGFLTHELRNPLATATMAAGRLKKLSQDAQPAGETLDMLDRGLHRIASQIDAVLVTQHLDAREMDCRPVDISLGQIMAEATRAAALGAKDKGIELATRYDPDIELHVDPGLATSALQNLLDNAVKFTDHGRVDVVTDDQATQVLIHVYDNCDGLSAEELKTIFEPFKRAHPRKSGTGLGLAIARRAVEAQGGQIGAESTGDRGCHFWLSLPKPKQ
jgi:hypothetical protein